MKELTFLRHAKSDWNFEAVKDIDRHLNERGYSDAYLLGSWYLKNQSMPDLVLTSTAIRAMSTALIFSRAIGLDMKKFQFHNNIYESSAAKLLQISRSLPEAADRVVLVGHNPAFTDMSNDLTDDVYFDNIPTCGMVSFQTNCKSWQELDSKKCTLNFYHFPKDFRKKT